jgi:hypothetical protein
LKYEVKAQKEENGAVKSSFDNRTETGSLLRQVQYILLVEQNSQAKLTTNSTLPSATDVSWWKALGAMFRG